MLGRNSESPLGPLNKTSRLQLKIIHRNQLVRTLSSLFGSNAIHMVAIPAVMYLHSWGTPESSSSQLQTRPFQTHHCLRVSCRGQALFAVQGRPPQARLPDCLVPLLLTGYCLQHSPCRHLHQPSASWMSSSAGLRQISTGNIILAPEIQL